MKDRYDLSPFMGEYLTPEQFAGLVDKSVRTIERWRTHGGGPKHLRIGNGRVIYSKAAIIAWSEEPEGTEPPGQPVALATLPDPLDRVQLARYLGITVAWVDRNLSKPGKLPRPVRVGKSLRWRHADINEWLASQPIVL